jgi:hypothetical protein
MDFQTFYLKFLWGSIGWCDPTILQTTFFTKHLISGFQTPLIKLDKGDFYVSICL